MGGRGRATEEVENVQLGGTLRCLHEEWGDPPAVETANTGKARLE